MVLSRILHNRAQDFGAGEITNQRNDQILLLVVLDDAKIFFRRKIATNIAVTFSGSHQRLVTDGCRWKGVTIEPIVHHGPALKTRGVDLSERMLIVGR